MVLGCVWVPSDSAPYTRGSPSTSRSFHPTISPTPLSFFYSHFHTFSTSLLVQACLLYFLDGITHLRRPTTMCLWVRASGCMCLCTSMCCTLLSSIGHIPVRATTSPVAMVVKQAENEGEEWRETDRQGRGGEENWMMSTCSGVYQGEEEGRTGYEREREEIRDLYLQLSHCSSTICLGR